MVLLFDAMGTLVHDPFYDAVPAFFERPLHALVKELDPSAWVEFELGCIDEPTFLGRFFRDGRPFAAHGMRECMVSAYAWIEGMRELVEELAGRGHPMHVLSNYPSWYQLIDHKLRVSEFLPWTFVSCEMGVRKPDLAAYLGPARHLGVAPERCLFIDDRPVNCDAARRAGMDAIVFRSAVETRRELVHRGLLPA